MTTADQVQQKLRALDGYDSLLSLLETLGFEFSDEPRSTADWPGPVKQDITISV